MATDKSKAQALVQTTDGVLHTYAETFETAAAQATESNAQAEKLGIKARYEAKTIGD